MIRSATIRPTRFFLLFSLCSSLVFALTSAAEQTPPDPQIWLKAGPMLGYSEIQETAIWLQTHGTHRVQIRFWPQGEAEVTRLSREILTTSHNNFIALFQLAGLRFGTRYDYEVYIDGHRLPPPSSESPNWSFQTQAMWRWRTDPPDLVAALGSCVYINETSFDRPGTPYGSHYEIFQTIADQQPDFMLWLGDNTYLREADWLTEAGIRHRYAHSRALPELQPLLAATHHYATWDDHDFGPNNSDRSYRGKEQTLQAFRDYWPNPDAGLPDTPGVFFRFEWADVEFFMLDNRSQRAPNNLQPSPEKLMHGESQMRWLRESLVSSLATFKIIVGGGQMINPVTYLPTRESWALYPHERDAFLEFLKRERIEGVLFLAGDRHHTELVRLQPDGLYPLYEFTSSPLTSGLGGIRRQEINNPLRLPGTWVNDAHNFGLLEVTGPPDERILTMRTLNHEGKELWRHEIRRQDLSMPEEKAP